MTTENRLQCMTGFCGMIAAAAMLASAGCASLKPARLPMGEWRGEGLYVYETRPAGGDGSKLISTSNRYPTSLSIQRGKLGDRDAIYVEVISRHQDIGILKDNVHLRMALEEAKRLSDDAVLYRVLAMTFNPDEELKPPAQDQPLVASCLRDGSAVVFQVVYPQATGMSECYRFQGGRVHKSGTIYAPEGHDGDEIGLIQWTESLGRKRGWGVAFSLVGCG